MTQQAALFRLQLELFVYKKIQDSIDESFEDWVESVIDWVFHPIFNGQELAAVVAVHKNEIHVVVDERFKKRWFRRKQITSIFQNILDEYGEVISSVKWGNDEAMKFVRKLGFKPLQTVCVLEELWKQQ